LRDVRFAAKDNGAGWYFSKEKEMGTVSAFSKSSLLLDLINS
jgi:hypothetical protein